jgi:hypothetical protein
MSYSDFPTKADFKRYHSKVVKYIKEEYKDFHFNKMRNGSLLIQLSPFDKHHFHLLIGTFSDPKESVSNVAGEIVNHLYQDMYNKHKDSSYYEQ